MVVKMRHLFVLALILTSFPALAQQTPVQAEKLPAPGTQQEAAPFGNEADNKPATPEEQAILLCESITIMGSTGDGPSAGADYEPGVDAYGRPVAPADAASQQYSLPDRIDIPLDIAILETVGIAPEPDLKANVGTISILKGGQVLYNDKNMTTTVQDYCNKHKAKAN